MSLVVFVNLLTILSTITALFTEAIKKNFNIKNSTLTVLIISAIMGWSGGAITYILMKIPFDVSNSLCLFLLAPAIWLCATI